MSEVKRLEINSWGDLAYAEEGHLVEYDDYVIQMNLAAQKVREKDALIQSQAERIDELDGFLHLALDYIDKCPSDPVIHLDQLDAWMKLRPKLKELVDLQDKQENDHG